MSLVDFIIFALYMAGVLGIGYYHFRRNQTAEDYYIGSRNIPASYVGLSLVATDVGGGFSIGLGGLGFVMGLSGSWLLFTGLAGAWLSAVFLIPRIKQLDRRYGFMTYPDFLRHRYNAKVALAASVISGLGYMGFTGAQLLAGAKLASGALIPTAPLGLSPLHFSLILIAVITIGYTVIGGLKAVIYTDALQWVILLSGLIFVTIPVTLWKIGGPGRLREALPAEFFSLTHISPMTFVNWMVTIIPIWLIGMTLYQRMYACKDAREARKAWFIAGLFEYPIMAFTGVVLGMCARVIFPEAESEMAMPMLIKEILPIGVTGIVIAAYFSAIMSTADSCLMASSGNFVNDILQRYFLPRMSEKTVMRLSQVATGLLGIGAVILAVGFEKVLDMILNAYAFMVAGLFIPTLGAYFWKRGSSAGALWGIVAGGVVALALLRGWVSLPEPLGRIGLDPCAYGIAASLAAFLAGSFLRPDVPACSPSDGDNDG